MNTRPAPLSLFSAALLGCIAATPVEAYALRDFFAPVPPNIAAAMSQVSLSLGALSQHYTEYLPGGVVFDSEHGRLYASGLAIGGQGPHFGTNLSLQVTKGSDQYIGGLQQINQNGTVTYIPTTGTTRNSIVDLQLAFREGFSPVRDLALLPTVVAGYNHWNRQLTGIGSYHESYSNGYYGGGLTAAVQFPGDLVFSTGFLAGRSNGPSLEADLTPSGGGVLTFHLGNEHWRQYNARLTWLVPHHTFSLYLDYDLTQFGYGQSPVVYGMSEPDSTTQWNTIMLGIAKRL
jgi:hypothetical protein